MDSPMKEPSFVYVIALLSCVLAPVITSYGQTNECPRTQGEGELNVGNVRARVLNNGGLFYRGQPHAYEIPIGSGIHAMFSTNIGVIGYINGELRAATTRYGEWEFWAGPLDDNGMPPTDCSLYDRVWEISRTDIESYFRTGIINDNLREWPWHIGAPVVDGDGVKGNYNVEGGDLPELRGDQRLWWVMNDRGGEHKSTESEPIGLEVYGSAHAFTHPGFISNSTFYQYEIINKNTAPFEEAYFGLHVDPDLGAFDDDYVGSDTLLHMGYVFNRDNLDDNYYGVAPPALGFTFVKSAIADSDDKDNDYDGETDEPGEMLGMHAFTVNDGDGGPWGEPQRAEGYYNYYKGLWRDGEPIYKGDFGRLEFFPSHLPQEITRYHFSGDPVTGEFWSSVNIDMQGTPTFTMDRRYMMSTGPFDISPGDTVSVAFAIVWSRGDNNLDSITRLRTETRRIHKNKDFFFSPITVFPVPLQAPPIPPLLDFDQNYPNPFSDITQLSYSLPKTMKVRLAVYDVLGKEVDLLVDALQDTGTYSITFDGSHLPAGIYYARIELDHLRFTQRMAKVTR